MITRYLGRTTPGGKRILRNADAIRDGGAPLDYWRTQAPVAEREERTR